MNTINCLLIVIGITIFAEQSRATPAKLAVNTAPIWYVKQANIQSLDQQGNLQYRLTAASISNYGANNTLLTAPKLTVYHNHQPVWLAVANNGEIITQNQAATKTNPWSKVQKINLTNQVTIKYLANGNYQASKLTTEQLTYYPQFSYAATNRHVIIQQLANRLEGDGMYLDTKQQTIKLLSKVTSTLDAQHVSVDN